MQTPARRASSLASLAHGCNGQHTRMMSLSCVTIGDGVAAIPQGRRIFRVIAARTSHIVRLKEREVRCSAEKLQKSREP